MTDASESRRAIDLNAAMEAIRTLPEEADRRSISLSSGAASSGGMQVVLLRLRAGAALAPHATRGRTTIHVLEGRAAVLADGADLELGSAQLVVLAAGEHHSVRALVDSTLLLTIAAAD